MDGGGEWACVQSVWVPALAVAVVVLSVVCLLPSKDKAEQHAPSSSTVKEKQGSGAAFKKAAGKGAKVSKKKKKKVEEEPHPLRVVSLKGHTAALTGATLSEQYVATTAEDRTLLLFPLSMIHQQNLQGFRVQLPLDHATACCFTPDGHHVVVALENSKSLVAYKLLAKKGEDGKRYKEVYQFKINNENPVECLNITANSKVFLLSSEDTVVELWSLKGKKLETINTNQMRTNMSCFAPNSRFFAVGAWTPDVRVWEIVYDKKTEEFHSVKKSLELKGHKSSVFSVDFSSDSTRCVTSSKDGTWKLWKLDVRYNIGEDPACLMTVSSPAPLNQLHHIAISPDNTTIAGASEERLYFFLMKDGSQVECVQDTGDGPVRILRWSQDSTMVLTAGNTHATLWRNPVTKQ